MKPKNTRKKAEKKKQSTRLLKAVCPRCGYLIRLSNRWVGTGLPVCSLDGTMFELDKKEDRKPT